MADKGWSTREDRLANLSNTHTQHAPGHAAARRSPGGARQEIFLNKSSGRVTPWGTRYPCITLGARWRCLLSVLRWPREEKSCMHRVGRVNHTADQWLPGVPREPSTRVGWGVVPVPLSTPQHTLSSPPACLLYQLFQNRRRRRNAA